MGDVLPFSSDKMLPCHSVRYDICESPSDLDKIEELNRGSSTNVGKISSLRVVQVECRGYWGYFHVLESFG